jgi:hypothetical protein
MDSGLLALAALLVRLVVEIILSPLDQSEKLLEMSVIQYDPLGKALPILLSQTIS